MEEVEEFDVFPKYYDMLSKEDQTMYINLRSGLSSHACRNRRGKRLETFSDMMNTIKQYCIRNSDSDWKRCLVCGVCWLPTGIAVNTRHLSLLIDKCKSSINGSLQKMGYNTVQCRTEFSQPLIDQIPILKNNFNELREWTIRQYVASTPTPQYGADINYFYNAMMQSPMPTFFSPMPQTNFVPFMSSDGQNFQSFMGPNTAPFYSPNPIFAMQQAFQKQQHQLLQQTNHKPKRPKHTPGKSPIPKPNTASSPETNLPPTPQPQPEQQTQPQDQIQNTQAKEEPKKDIMDIPLEPFKTSKTENIPDATNFFEGDPLSLTPSFLYDVDFFDDQ